MLIRKGECRRCGVCCEQAGRFVYLWPKPEMSGFGDFKLGEILPFDESMMPCSHLIYDIENRRAICIDHENGKKPICKMYPISQAEIINPDCGFFFEEV